MGYSHITINIYEAVPEFVEIGAGLLLGPNIVRALKCISPKVHEAYMRLQTGNMDPKHKNTWYDFVYVTGSHVGEKICSVKSETGQSSVYRGKLLEALVSLIPLKIAHLGKRTKSIEQSDKGTILYFDDGISAQTDYMIGADSVHSPTRKAVFSESWNDYEPVFHWRDWLQRDPFPWKRRVKPWETSWL